MAWGVRCAQLGKQRGLIACLSVTLICAVRVPGDQVHGIQGQMGPPHGAGPGGDRQLVRRGVRIGSVPGEPPPRGFHPHKEYLIEKLEHADEEAGVRMPPEALYEAELDERVDNLGTFFGIYFCLTGLHAVHVICGIIAITWLLVRAVKGHFQQRVLRCR